MADAPEAEDPSRNSTSGYLNMMAGKAAGARGKKARTVRKPRAADDEAATTDTPSNPLFAAAAESGAASSVPDALELLEVEIMKPSQTSILGIACDPHPDQIGVVVCEMLPTGLAAKSGLVYVGDVVVHVGGQHVSEPTDAAKKMRACEGTVALDVLCTTPAQLALDPPHVMDTILSLRLMASEKQYLVRWSPSERRTWATLDELMACGGREMYEHFEATCTQMDLTISRSKKSGGFGIELAGNYVAAISADSTAKYADALCLAMLNALAVSREQFSDARCLQA